METTKKQERPPQKATFSFSAYWRREGDSNPRYGFTPHDDLANRCLQPLSHPSKSLPRIISNTLFAVNEDRHRLPRLGIDDYEIGSEALFDLAKLVAPPQFNRLIPRRGADQILESDAGDFMDILEPVAHPQGGSGKIAALDETRLAALELHL